MSPATLWVFNVWAHIEGQVSGNADSSGQVSIMDPHKSWLRPILLLDVVSAIQAMAWSQVLCPHHGSCLP